MKRFKCSLQRVLDVREVAVNQCEALLAESNRALNARQAEHRQCGEELHRASEKILADARRAGRPFRECLAERAWFQHLSERLQSAGKATRQESAAVDARRSNLQKAMLEHKVIENLSRRERCDWLERLRQAEQKSMDEVASGTVERRKHASRHSGPPSIPNPARSP